ncbi:MAG: hypothetical protein NT054_01290 [Burkholderiales bacterium]|jgi:hypothetical protein|nr:hypothetical protein [Burkholderiales bacterium]
MAVGQNQRTRKNDSMLTKTGKPRLGPLNHAQLTKLIESSTKPKDKNKLVRALAKQKPSAATLAAAAAAVTAATNVASAAAVPMVEAAAVAEATPAAEAPEATPAAELPQNSTPG